MTRDGKLFVCSEVTEGSVSGEAAELLAIGRKLAGQMGVPLSVLFVGEKAGEAAKGAISLGGDVVFSVEAPPFAGLHPDVYAALFKDLLDRLGASVVLFSHTEMGREVALRLAPMIGAGITMDCTQVTMEPETGELLLSRFVYGGNAVAVWAADGGKRQVVTVRPRASAPAEPDGSHTGEVVPMEAPVAPWAARGTLLEAIKEKVEGIKLEDAEVIVAGGGGVGSAEGFKLLEELARLLGGTIGASRIPCDEGWLPLSLEIGQTGHIVSPRLYFAVGISGAPQHMTGCSGAKLLVAINRDPDANIFKEADFGVVADYKQVLPTLIERCRSFLS